MSNKNLWISVLVIVVLGLVLWLMLRGDTPEDVTLEEQNTNTAVEQEVEGTEDRSEGSVNASGSVTATSYQAALAKYVNTRIQLDNSCQAVPNNATYKNGTDIMIDNRSAASRTINLGSTFTVKPYSFKIVKLSSSTTPATWLMDCDDKENVATVLIQK